ncbi:MAG: hypothetical protein R3B72_17845 [Polyangiaceae bacterium]
MVTRHTDSLKVGGALLAWALLGCGAEGAIPGGGGPLPEGACGRGLLVVASDYQSTNTSLVDPEGVVIQPSFLSSASADPGISAALSGDVVAPTDRVTAEAVLIDRFPAAVVTWVDVASGEVTAQLDVSTGFPSNPQDLLRIGDRGFVSRYETNPTPGTEPHDAGGDVLEIAFDPEPRVAGRIDLAPAMMDAPGFLPRAGKLLAVGGEAWVALLSAFAADFVTSAPSRLVTFEGTQMVDVHVLEGLHGCTTLARASEGSVAVGCSGDFGGSSTADPATAGVVWLERDGDGWREDARFDGAALGGAVGFGLAVGLTPSGAPRILATTLGETDELGDPVRLDRLLALDPSGAAPPEEVLASAPFQLGELRCLGPVASGRAASCGSCWAADAEAGVLHRLRLSEGEVELEGSLVVDESIGLPPRYLGGL